AVITRGFRRAGPVGRRQLKWVVYGLYMGLVPVLLTDLVTALVPRLWWLHEAAVIAEAAIPLSIITAIVRFNFFDIDRLIAATAVASPPADRDVLRLRAARRRLRPSLPAWRPLAARAPPAIEPDARRHRSLERAHRPPGARRRGPAARPRAGRGRDARVAARP